MSLCLICQSEIQPFISFGQMPIANGFLSPEQFAEEYFFELRLAFCQTCKMVQLMEQPDREKMFHDNYAFFSSTSTRMAQHFAEFAQAGSNDGIMLQNFQRAGIRHLGIEPSANVAQVARDKGIQTISKFFDQDLARAIVAEHGQAEAFLGANVMCHIPYLHSVAEGIKILLKPEGVLVFEDPYLGDIVERTSYDQIYDEHAFYFSLSSVANLFSRHGLELIDAIPQPVHGGSMRYVLGHEGKYQPSPALSALREKENQLGLHQPETYEKLRRNIEQSRTDLISLLRKLRDERKRVVGYAATSKSTTVTNYCGITSDLVEFISDTTPIKQGKFNPGTHIPVRSYEEFTASYPDCALLFGWNHAEEIMAKEVNFKAAGGNWIVYVPRVQVLK